MADTITGADKLRKNDCEPLKGKSIGLICNSTSIDAHYNYLFEKFNENKKIKLNAILGPQHGLFPHTPENMVEWESRYNQRLDLKIYSLYGENRKPTEEMLNELDALVFDIQDVGSRYYTYIWTMYLAMESAAEFNKEFIVLDRPNPINGINCQGPVLTEEFFSFMGLAPLPIRHGLTIGELAMMFNEEINSELSVIKMEGWERKMWYDETGLPWVPSSPNMPTINTATVYPGMCLLEGTNISAGRGTTFPFQVFGAPFIKPFKLKEELEKYDCEGVHFRPHYFTPLHGKWKEEKCGGLYLHLVDRNKFHPIVSAIAILKEVSCLYPRKFRWKDPPYEYDYEHYPFDILIGDSEYRQFLQDGKTVSQIRNLWKEDLEDFKEKRKEYLLYI